MLVSGAAISATWGPPFAVSHGPADGKDDNLGHLVVPELPDLTVSCHVSSFAVSPPTAKPLPSVS